MFSLQSFCVCVRHARERYIYLPEFLLLDGKLVGKYTNPMATSQDIIRYCLSKNTQTFPHLSSTRDRSWRDEEKRRCVLGIPEMKACDRWTVDRLPSLGRSTWLKEPCGHAHVPDIFFGGGEWGCNRIWKGGVSDRISFWTFSGSHFARNMSSDGAEKQLTAEVTISYCVQLWVDRYVIQWQLRIMNHNKIIKLGIQYFDIHFMLIIIIPIWFSKQPKPSKHHFCSKKNDIFHQHHFMNQVMAFFVTVTVVMLLTLGWLLRKS